MSGVDSLLNQGSGIFKGSSIYNPSSVSSVMGFKDPSVSQNQKEMTSSSSISDIYKQEFDNLGKGIDYLRARAAAGDSWAIDKYFSYMLSEQSANTAREWEEKMNSSAYQRMVQDLQKAGINPYFALSGGNPISSSTQGVNYQGSQATSASNTDKNIKAKLAVAYINGLTKIITSLLSSAGSVLSMVA